MGLTRDFRETVVKHVQDDTAFRAALVEEAVRRVMDGDLETALGQIRDVVNATLGIDALAAETGLRRPASCGCLAAVGPHAPGTWWRF